MLLIPCLFPRDSRAPRYSPLPGDRGVPAGAEQLANVELEHTPLPTRRAAEPHRGSRRGPTLEMDGRGARRARAHAQGARDVARRVGREAEERQAERGPGHRDDGDEGAREGARDAPAEAVQAQGA